MGILGGTFNPPHLGHVALARHALGELGLERVLLMPAHSAPHKLVGADPGPGHRLRMCVLAARDCVGLTACAMEVERGGPSYTVDTLRALHASHPGARLTFIVGADTARTMPEWREPRELLEMVDLGVAERAGSGSGAPWEAVAPGSGAPWEAVAPGEEGVMDGISSDSGVGAAGGDAASATDGRQDVLRALGGVDGQARVRFLTMPRVAISSSMVRARVARGRPVEKLVGDAVARYIAEQRLYRATDDGGEQ